MKLSTKFITLALCFLNIGAISNAYATQYLCSSAKETEFKYLTQGDPNKGQYSSFFAVNNVTTQDVFTLTTDDNHNTSMIKFTNSDKNKNTLESSSTLNLVNKNNEQITYTGLLNNNPLLLTLYLKNKTVVYSMHSPNGKNEGIHVNVLYANCKQ